MTQHLRSQWHWFDHFILLLRCIWLIGSIVQYSSLVVFSPQVMIFGYLGARTLKSKIIAGLVFILLIPLTNVIGQLHISWRRDLGQRRNVSFRSVEFAIAWIYGK